MTVSGGIVEAGEYRMTAGELLRSADKALYAAKQAGRDRIVIFETNHTSRGKHLPQVAETNILHLADVVEGHLPYD